MHTETLPTLASAGRRLRALPIALTLVLGACGSSTIQNPTPVSALPTAAQVEEAYYIAPGDTMDVKFFYNPELNDEVTVRPDGRISLPLVGEVRAAGRTPGELEADLRNAYSRELRQPNVSVILRDFAGQKAYVAGEVAQPNAIPLAGGMTALQAVAAAGGFKTTAYEDQVILIRRVPGAKPVAVALNLQSAITGGDMSQDVTLRPYDVVYVPRSPVANVNLFIDQYIRQNIPIPFGLGWSINGN